MAVPANLDFLNQQIVACDRCPRLRQYCIQAAREKRRAWRDWEYWGKPVPGFGDPGARLLVIGLAPGAHGANRTGRMFTGDSSGDFLFPVLHRTGFATQAESRSRDDGLRLRDCYIGAAARCAPPDNKPAREELAHCREYLEHELTLLRRVTVVVALGRIAFDTFLAIERERGSIESRLGFLFRHGAEYHLGEGRPVLIGSYHPSRQNTSTGRLTEPMLRAVFERARVLIKVRPGASNKR